MPNSVILDNLNYYFISNLIKGSIDQHIEFSIDKTPFNYENLCIPNQVHSNTVIWVDKPGKYDKCDGIVTNISNNLILALSTADCLPIILSDKKTGNFALIHAGWRGVIQKIANAGIEIMIKRGSIIDDIDCFFGPSISQNMYPVDYDVASQFLNKFYYKKEKKYFLDIRGQTISDILSLGINNKKIVLSNECTYKNSEICSYRRDGNDVGRNITLVGKKND